MKLIDQIKKWLIVHQFAVKESISNYAAEALDLELRLNRINRKSEQIEKKIRQDILKSEINLIKKADN